MLDTLVITETQQVDEVMGLTANRIPINKEAIKLDKIYIYTP